MPPSPDLTASLNEAVWKRVIEELDLVGREPTIAFSPGKGKGVYSGIYYAGRHHISVECGWEDYTRDRLMSVMNELARVVLHEVRHAHQWIHWENGRKDNVLERERDAVEYEDALARFRGLVRVTRRQHNSPFSRLAAAQDRVRQTV